jgi:acylphosphatase
VERDGKLSVQPAYMDKSTGLERRTVVYSGHVQGVGFRAIVLHQSKGFAVSGYVRNLDDGCVELVVEGSADQIEPFLAAIADELGQFIRHVQVTRSTATGEFRTFGIQV